MNYRTRHAENKIKELEGYFKIILVTGARQVGKSTLLQHLFPHIKSIVFDPVQDIYNARRDPDLFLNNFPPPMILDEIQFVPELLPAIKRKADMRDTPGQYFLTGSQNLSVLRSVTESMAGRVGIVQLETLTAPEASGAGATGVWLSEYLKNPEGLAGSLGEPSLPAESLLRTLWRGSMPGLLDMPDGLVPDYFRSYIQTYVERDVRLLEDIRETASFSRFLGLAAALTTGEINAAQLGRDIGVSPHTARKWLDLLAGTYQWFELFPYHGNTIKRLSGKKKGYVSDTGMACYLQRISSPEALAVSPALGALFETWVVNEIKKQFVCLSTPPAAYHWRTGGGAEVDLLLERDGFFYPVEVKCKSNLNKKDARGIRAFRETYLENRMRPGLIIYTGQSCHMLDEQTIALPWNACLKA